MSVETFSLRGNNEKILVEFPIAFRHSLTYGEIVDKLFKENIDDIEAQTRNMRRWNPFAPPIWSKKLKSIASSGV